jgi:hypothetical protein
MNEKVKQLAKQARQIGEYGNYGQIQLGTAQFEQKFAELIVGECADWVKSRTMSGELRDELKRHFGVK